MGGQIALEAIKTPKDATDYSVKWSTNKKKLATVDEDGLLTAHKEGTVTVKAVSKKQKKKAKIKITIQKIPVTSIAYAANNPTTMEAGTQRTLSVQIAGKRHLSKSKVDIQ